MENYKGTIDLISGLRQANNGNFFLLNTDQIQATPEGMNLTEYLEVKGVSDEVINSITPSIKGGMWYVGDNNTSVRAEGVQGEQGPQGETGEQGPQGETGLTGPQGRGISSINQNLSTEDGDNNTITINYTDNTTPTTFTIKNGSKGSTGNAGRGITSITESLSNIDGGTNDYTITYTDQTTTTVHTKNGEKGDAGNGISSVTKGQETTEKTVYNINYTQTNNVDTFEVKHGQNGQDGEDGFNPAVTVNKDSITGITSISITQKIGNPVVTVLDDIPMQNAMNDIADAVDYILHEYEPEIS